MKIKRNKKSYKWFLCGLIMVVVLTISYRVSKANYRISNSIELTTGKVISSPYDFNIVSMYIDGVEQSKDTTMPGKGYVLTSDSYCYKDNKNNKDSNVILETNKYGEHIIGELSKSSKCVLYFERKEGIDTASKYILSKISEVTHRKRGTFNQVIEEETTGKIYVDSDDDGVTYYYAGNPQDNWVLFGGYYWRIIRINGDGTIRMIYQGKESEGPQTTGEGTIIGKTAFNAYEPNTADNKYAGYRYEQDVVHGYSEPSLVYTYLNNWFNNSNLKQEQYFNKIDENAGFCGDRTFAWDYANKEEYGINRMSTTFGIAKRMQPNFKVELPIFNCLDKRDLYTYTGANQGNKSLENPVGLIAADETFFAGFIFDLFSGGVNTYANTYLNNGINSWSMTPYWTSFKDNNSNDDNIVRIIGANGLYFYATYSDAGIRPVINIRSDVNLSGDGTSSNPYKVVN